MNRRIDKRRFLARVALSLLTVTAFVTLVIVVVVNSETLSRGLLRHAAAILDIEIEQISGTLAAGLSLERLHYRNDAVDISVDKLDLDWEPSALLYATCKIRALRAVHVSIRYTPAAGAQGAGAKTPLSDFSLPLRIALAAGEIRGMQVDYGPQSFALNRVLLDGTLDSRLNVNRLSVAAPAYSLTAQASVDSRFPFAGELALQWRYTHPSFELAGAGRISGDIRRLELEHTLSQPGSLSTSGYLLTGVAGGMPHAELHNRWSGLQPPLMPFPLGTDGELHASGWLDDYRLRGQGNVQAPELPPLKFSLAAGGDHGGLHTTSIQLQALNGTAGIKGSIQWLPALEWQTDIAAANIDLRSLYPQLPERLGLDLHSTGSHSSGQWSARLDRIRGEGSLRSRPLRLKGALEFKGGSFKSPGLELAVAENSLSLSGGFDRQRIDAEWRLRAPRLAALWRGLAGTLNADGRASGARNSPRLTASLDGGQLVYDKYRVGSLHATLETTDRQQYALSVAAERLTFDGRTASAFSLNARGNAAAHHIDSRLQGDALGASLIIDGAYLNKHWHGRLLNAELQPARLPAWALQQPVAINFGGGSLRFDPACWSAADAARVCVELDAAAKGSLRGKAGLSAVPAGLLDAWLGPRVTLNGLIDGTLDLGGTRANPTATLDLKADAGTIGIRREGTPADNYRWEQATLRMELRAQRLTANTSLAFPGYGTAQGNFAVQLHNRKLEGDITARFHNLAPLQTLIPDIAELNGDLETSLKLGGTLERPAITGSLLLADASARIPRWGIGIDGLRLEARGEPGGKVAFEGSAESGPGRLRLDGTLAWAKAPALEARVEGENFEILHLPAVQARISPRLDIRAGQDHMDAQGVIRIPSAHMNIKTLPESAVKVSQDAVLTDETGHARGNFRLSSRLQLILGDDVKFEGFGFNAGLDGQLTLNKPPGRPLAANGELTVRQGQYKAFGQQLDIERGRLLFQGPYDNPGLDILALRRTPDVSVNLEIGGTLENPESRVYSEPPLPDSEAMAILLTGKPLGSATETDANALVGAVAALGMKKGKFITDDIARTLNLDEFNIQSEGDVSKSSLFIGKRISPRLFIRYIVGLFDQTSRIGLSYQLSKNLKLEAESGWNQSMDLIYEIER
ncbi:MAG TPA: translocation/assembly module TamB domain-containing protein [Gammaproteobacteria bacterium]|nr:translocation/assembly module TamB domain-containing protein [Gammaproteobacteria bacterium]